MAEKIKPSPTADKMLTIICNSLLISREAINVDTTFEDLKMRNSEKVDLLCKIADRFKIPRENRLLNLHGPDGRYIKDTFEGHLRRIKTIWNVLQFIEANDDYNGKPAALNLL